MGMLHTISKFTPEISTNKTKRLQFTILGRNVPNFCILTLGDSRCI